MNDQVKESALNQVSKQLFFVAMEQGNPESFVLHIVKVTFNSHVSALAAPVLQEVAVTIVIPKHPDHRAL
jgi:hypothetical protein